MKTIRKITICLIISVILFAFTGCSEAQNNSAKNTCIAQVKQNATSVLTEEGVSDYTISESIYSEGGNNYCMEVNIPSFEEMDDKEKISLLDKLTNASEGFFINESDWNMIFLKVTSNGNIYSAYDNYEYYKNGVAVTVYEKPTTTEKKTSYDSDDKDSGYSYDKNDSYYSDNDYDNDGKINGEEFQGAVGDYMDDYYDSDYDYDYDYGYDYDNNDSYYSNNDYNSDGKINQDEFQGAVGDFMDAYGY